MSNTLVFKNCKECACLVCYEWEGRNELVPCCEKYDIGDVNPDMDGCTFYEDKESEEKK